MWQIKSIQKQTNSNGKKYWAVNQTAHRKLELKQARIQMRALNNSSNNIKYFIQKDENNS